MRLRTVILAIAGLVALVVIALVVIVATIDPNDYRAEIQQTVEDATGRKLTLGGDLEMGLSLSPSIIARDVALADATWGTQSQMLQAKELDVQVELLPLISGEIHIIRLVLKGANILLETNADGTGNWQFGGGDASGAVAADNALLPRIDSMDFDDVKIAFVDGATGNRHDIDLDTVTLSSEGPSSALNVDVKATVNGSAVTAVGAAGSLDALMRGGTGPVDLTIDAFGVAITLKGTVTDITGGGNLNLDFNVASDSLAEAASVANMATPVPGPASLSGHIDGDFEKFELSGLAAEAGGLKTTGNVTLDLTGDRPSLDGKLSLDKLDLSAFDGEGAGSDTASSGKVFPSDPLPVDVLRLADVDLEIDIATLVTPVLVAHDVVVPIKLTSGDLKIDPLTANVASSSMTSTLGLNASGDTPQMALTLEADKLDVGKMLQDADVTDVLSGLGDLKVDVQGNGVSIAAIMAALNGNASLLMEDGRLDAGGLEVLMGGTNALVGTMFASDTDAATMSCLAIDYDIQDGIADQKVFLIDTQCSILVGEGKIDLKNETLDLLITPNSKGVSLNVTVPVRVRGTLASPTYTPDEAALALKLGALVGGALFPPALLLSLGDLGGGSDHGCVSANTNASASGGGVVDGAGEVVDDAAGAIGDAVDGIGDEIDSLFGD